MLVREILKAFVSDKADSDRTTKIGFNKHLELH